MKDRTDITVLFLDIGGLLLTNGWDRAARRRVAEQFHLDWEEMDERHHLTFDTYERGLLSLDDYLRRIVFHRARTFTAAQLKTCMFEQSQLLDDNIGVFRRMAAVHHLKVGAISNEGRELALHRIRTFRLPELIDFFVVSSFVHFRKPDEEMFRLALDIAQVAPERAVYIDDRLLFTEVARGLGIHSIHHETLDRTRAALARMGLDSDTPV